MSVFTNLKSLAGTQYHHLNHSSDIMDISFLRQAAEEGFRLPSAQSIEREEGSLTSHSREKYRGAYVETPTAGVHHNVAYYDLASLYPNTFVSLNVSPETLLGTKDKMESTQFEVHTINGEEWVSPINVRKEEFLNWDWTAETVAGSAISEDECVNGYIDTRDVKWVDGDSGEDWHDYTDPSKYKTVCDSSSQTKKKWEADSPEFTKCYYIHPQYKKGFMSATIEEWIEEKYRYTGELYDAIKAIVNCFSPDTDVVTPNGIKNIRELEVGDKVYSFDTDENEVEVKPVTRTFSYDDYNGDLIHFENQYTDLKVTPNHDMLVENVNHERNHEYNRVEAGNLHKGTSYEHPSTWDEIGGEELVEVNLCDYTEGAEVLVKPSVHGHTFRTEVDGEVHRIPFRGGSGYVLQQSVYQDNREYVMDVAEETFIHSERKQKWVPLMYDGDNFLSLLAWYITEGSSHTSEDKMYGDKLRGSSTKFKICQCEGEHYGRIGDLLDRMNLDYYNDEKGYSVCSDVLTNILRELGGQGSFEKKIPQFVFDVSVRQKELFFQTLMDGDGDSLETSYRYTTSSDSLKDDVMELCLHLGITPKIGHDTGSWRIYCYDGGHTLRPHRCAERTQAEGGVYCVEVADNHSLLAGRNGKFQWVGQSSYGYTGTPNSRLFDWRIAETITLSGQKIWKYTAKEATERLSERTGDDIFVSVGDTDGMGLTWESGDYETFMTHLSEITEYINGDGYDSFMKEEFGVDDHSMEVEVESYAQSLFVPAVNPQSNDDLGVKKRYAQLFSHNEADGGGDEYGMEEDDSLSITGLEAKRSDVSPLTTEAQKYVLEQLLRNGVEDSWDEVSSYLRQKREEVLEGDVDVEYVAKRSGIGKEIESYGTANRKPSTAYRGAKFADKEVSGESISEGSKVSIVYVKEGQTGPLLPSTFDSETAEDGDPVDVIAVEEMNNLPNGVTVDWAKHYQKSLKEPLSPIIRTVGWTWSEIKSGQRQQSLAGF